MTIFLVISLLLFIAAIFIVAMVMPKDSSISSSVVIDRSQAEVFDYIRLMRNQEKYSKWVMADPNVKLVYTGTDGTVGFISSWASEEKNVGVGAQEITNIIDGIGYEAEIRFEKPFKGISYASMMTEPISATQTKATNTFNSSTPIPMNLIMPILKKMLQKDMDETTANLKRVLEAN
jgi:Polyketide cyclase / dehydrase and lipid transport